MHASLETLPDKSRLLNAILANLNQLLHDASMNISKVI